MNAVKSFLAEASLGCLMAVLPTVDAVPILAWTHEVVRPEDLMGDGLESCPHVTVAYGFQPGVTPQQVQQVLTSWGKTQLRFTLGSISRFSDNPAYDVLNVSITFDDDLVELNALLAATLGDKLTQTYAYAAHLTVAYVRKGACPRLDGHAKLQGNTYVLDTLVYSLPESTSKFALSLGAA